MTRRVGAWPQYRDGWDSWTADEGDGIVYIVATGPLMDEVTSRIKNACDVLGLAWAVWDQRFLRSLSFPKARAIITYDDESTPIPSIISALAKIKNIPVIFLYKQDQDFNTYKRGLARWVAYDANLGIVGFDNPLTITDSLSKAIANLFSTLQLVGTARKEGWNKPMYVGLIEDAQLHNELGQTLQQGPIISSDMWKYRQRLLVQETHEKIRRARELARELIDDKGYVLPIPISAIIRDNGITILTDPIYTKSGQINSIDGIGVIWINPNDSPGRQNFTLAHELGHRLLKHGPVCYRPLPGEEWVYRPNEIVADAFASEVLMPETLVKAAFAEAQEWARIHDLTIEDLVKRVASDCNVTKSAVLRRLRFLKLLSTSRSY